MNAIVAVDERWGIGKNNGMLFHLPKDLKFFKDTTIGNIVIMGANTLKSFPNKKPLPNRENIVLSSTLEQDDITIVRTLEDLKNKIKKLDKDKVFLIGGGMLYKTLLPYCEYAYVTKVKANGDAQVFFENLDDNPNWELIDSSEEIEDGEYKLVFTKYINHQVKAL